ncbi:MAG: protein of unknown function with transmembrane region [Candidatus Campbellbacteria bacterium GW2011_OD1_34_28]|nr:MAG: protein of unknown function with transmembrane region [Candidatus Campbellbacteria bacterium GW2011_OD1_34_28]
MSEILYIFKVAIIILMFLLIYGVSAMLIVPIDYSYAEPFISVAVFLFMPVAIFFPDISANVMQFVAELESSFGNGNGFFTVLFSFLVVAVYIAIFSAFYEWAEKTDKRKYATQI